MCYEQVTREQIAFAFPPLSKDDCWLADQVPPPSIPAGKKRKASEDSERLLISVMRPKLDMAHRREINVTVNRQPGSLIT
ncbi:hypothetical protein BT69DRAFT_1280618 [Atractiella rhizophila]|nr:hypothetical protein BT69DRAFT_1280618 [Atractiella rhizophila]